MHYLMIHFLRIGEEAFDCIVMDSRDGEGSRKIGTLAMSYDLMQNVSWMHIAHLCLIKPNSSFCVLHKKGANNFTEQVPLNTLPTCVL